MSLGKALIYSTIIIGGAYIASTSLSPTPEQFKQKYSKAKPGFLSTNEKQKQDFLNAIKNNTNIKLKHSTTTSENKDK